MFNNRFIGIMAVLAIVVVLAVSYSFLGVFASSPESEAGRDTLTDTNEVGVKAYKQSEWADYQRAPSRVIAEGLAIYHQSERNSTSVELAVSNEEGLAIYQQSERRSIAPIRENELGLATYHTSERNSDAALKANRDGMAIYHQSERSGGVTSSPQLDFQPINSNLRSKRL